MTTSRIFKYPLGVLEKQTLSLPSNARIIRVEDIGGMFWLWAMVDQTILATEDRRIEMHKTGNDIPDAHELVYLGCCKLYIQMELCLYTFERLPQ